MPGARGIGCRPVPEVRWGLTLPFAGVPLADHEPLVRRAEVAGYDDLWSGEATGFDGFTPLALAAGWTERLRLGTGVVNPYHRGPAPMGPTGPGAGHRGRQPVHRRAGADGPAGSGAGRRQRGPVRARHRRVVGSHRGALER